MEFYELPFKKIHLLQQSALIRLHVYFTGFTHEVFSDFLNGVIGKLNSLADKEGHIDAVSLLAVQEYVKSEWGNAFAKWEKAFQVLRREAAKIPFGQMARAHHYYMSFAREELNERIIVEATGFSGSFGPLIDRLISSANARVYSDGFVLSQRIWKLNSSSLAGIQAKLVAGVGDNRGAWDLAHDLENYLGVGRDCPRWTRTRLYKLTKKDIAGGDQTGLISGSPCNSKGVSYNALRLARNEIQIVHHMASDRVFQMSPWVTGENIVLSPSHPVPDECDDVVADNPHEVGAVTLPIHVQCLCFKEAVLLPLGEFANRLRGWLYGVESWPNMDSYASDLGVVNRFDILDAVMVGGAAAALITWLYGGEGDLDGAAE